MGFCYSCGTHDTEHYHTCKKCQYEIELSREYLLAITNKDYYKARKIIEEVNKDGHFRR